MLSTILLAGLAYAPTAMAAGYRVAGNSGCASQMVFIPPWSNKAVFIDNYHPNYGSGINLQTGAHSSTPYKYSDGSNLYVFGTEFDLNTGTIRPLKPKDNTFCSAGAFFPDGTLMNVAGAEAASADGAIQWNDNQPITSGFQRLRTYAPCAADGTCKQDWTESSKALQAKRWYPSAETLTDGSVLVVGGSNAGLLVLNEANINVPTYEIVYQDGRKAPNAVTLPILQFNASQNLTPGKSYNLYPILALLPNTNNANLVFTIAGNQAIVWDYTNNKLYKQLPNCPLAPRTFPSSATAVLLPLTGPDFTPTMLICGGSSGDMPNPKGLADCWTINPLDSNPVWTRTDDMPTPRTMGDGILLPDGTVLILNGAKTGSGGGFMAENPAFAPVIYNPAAAAGSRFTVMPSTNIPRMYHSVATLMPSGEVLVSGSNPAVFYSNTGTVPSNWPSFSNNGHTAALNQQQSKSSAYPTEYRVEIFSPNYMSNTRPVWRNVPTAIKYGASFQVSAELINRPVRGDVKFMLMAPGFHTHGVGMGQRALQFLGTPSSNSPVWTLAAPVRSSVMPPGVYLLYIVANGVPSVGSWVQLS